MSQTSKLHNLFQEKNTYEVTTALLDWDHINSNKKNFAVQIYTIKPLNYLLKIFFVIQTFVLCYRNYWKASHNSVNSFLWTNMSTFFFFFFFLSWQCLNNNKIANLCIVYGRTVKKNREIFCCISGLVATPL